MKNHLLFQQVNDSLKTCLLLLMAFVWSGQTAFAQSLIEQTGGVKTNFVITTAAAEMPIIAQAILKRGVFQTSYESYGTDAYAGHAYGLQTYHLEFATTAKIAERFDTQGGVKRKYCEIKLLDASNEPLLVLGIALDSISVVSNGNGLNTYSINIHRVPMILLDRTKTISIETVRTYE